MFYKYFQVINRDLKYFVDHRIIFSTLYSSFNFIGRIDGARTKQTNYCTLSDLQLFIVPGYICILNKKERKKKLGAQQGCPPLVLCEIVSHNKWHCYKSGDSLVNSTLAIGTALNAAWLSATGVLTSAHCHTTLLTEVRMPRSHVNHFAMGKFTVQN